MHEGKHGILDDPDDMDSLFGNGEKGESEAGGHTHKHGHDHGHDEHAGSKDNQDK